MELGSLESRNTLRPLPRLKFTGERIVPGQIAEDLFGEHQARYQLAGNFVQRKDVVDVACGTGIGTEYLHRAGAKSCLGLDIDRDAVQYAKVAYPACRYIRCDATRMPLADGSVDVVVSFETIEHLPDALKFLKECKRILRRGGLLICSTPNRAISRWAQPNPFHVREFEAQEFLHLLAGLFVEVDAYGQHERIYPLLPPRAVLSRMLDSLGLKEPVRKLLGRTPSPLSTKSEFDSHPDGAEGELGRYSPSWLLKPTYLIAVARRLS